MLSPNFFTLLGLLLSLTAAGMMGYGHAGWASLVFAAGSLMDAVDGAVARRRQTVHRSGAVLDSVADRVAELGICCAFVVHFRGDICGTAAALMALSGSVLVSYSSSKAEIYGIKLPRGIMRRAERAVLFSLGMLFAWFFSEDLFLVGTLFAIGLFSLTTATHRTVILIRALNRENPEA